MATNASAHHKKPLHPALYQWSNWDCCICCDHQQTGRPWLTREDDSVCEDCVYNLFSKALEHDVHYPAKWGPEELDVEDFRSMLGDRIANRYNRTGIRIVEENRLLRPALVPGLKRGEDYQLCPSCQRPICLEDGCNHIICPCGTNFCLICGQEALENGNGHWNTGRCPRWNTFGSGNEQYDLENDGDDEDDDEQEEEDVNPNANDVDREDDDAVSHSESDVGDEQFTRLQEASYNFNVAVQTSSPAVANVLGAFLTAPILLHTPGTRHTILTAMAQFQPEYHDAAVWHNDFLGRTARHEEFIDFIVSIPPRPRNNGIEHFVFHEGPAEALRRPVGGYFNMFSLQQRLAACSWLTERVGGPRMQDEQMRFAWFDTHREGGPWLDNLYNSQESKVFLLPSHTILFDFLQSGCLVEVRERENAAQNGDVLRVFGELASLCAFLVDPRHFILPRELPGLHERR